MHEGKIKNIEQIIDEIIEIGYDHFEHLSPEINSENPKYSILDLKFMIIELFQLLSRFKENLKLLKTLEHDTVNLIENNLARFKSQSLSLKNRKPGLSITPDQFNNVLQLIVEFYRTIRQCGIYSVLYPSEKIVEYESVIDSIKTRSEAALKSAEKSQEAIKDLIPKATASSLAAAIQNRIIGLYWSVGIYMVLFVFGVIMLLCMSSSFLNMEVKAIECNGQIGLETWLKRLLYIVPAIYLILFAGRQYSKERKLLEIYIHKRTIAQSIPAYMEQASDDKKDEILLRGSTMIFSLPENPDTPLPGDGIGLSDVKDVLKIGKS